MIISELSVLVLSKSVRKNISLQQLDPHTVMKASRLQELNIFKYGILPFHKPQILTIIFYSFPQLYSILHCIQ